MSYRAATTDPTVCDMTNHAFWNLAGGGTIDSHRLHVLADRVIECDDDLVPSGRLADVCGSDIDFSMPRPIGATRIDHCFALAGRIHAAVLTDPTSGRELRIRTNQPGLAVYTTDHFTRPRAGICLQTGVWPDAPNQPVFPSARLDPDQVYRHRGVYDFTINDTLG